MATFIDPSPENFEAFKALPRDTPINMLNLLRFRETAQYPEGHPNAGKGWSGRRAYAEYGKVVGPIFERIGASVIWRGSCEAMVIGPDDKHWDEAFIAAFHGASAFLELVTDADYREGVGNRTAALIDSRLIRFAPESASALFG